MSVKIERETAEGGKVLIARLIRPDLPSDKPFDLDLLQAVALESELGQLTKGSDKRIVLDLARVAYMDSKTFWAMVRAAKSLKEVGGRMVVSNLHGSVQRLLALTGSHRFIQAFGSIEEAASALLAG